MSFQSFWAGARAPRTWHVAVDIKEWLSPLKRSKTTRTSGERASHSNNENGKRIAQIGGDPNRSRGSGNRRGRGENVHRVENRRARRANVRRRFAAATERTNSNVGSAETRNGRIRRHFEWRRPGRMRTSPAYGLRKIDTTSRRSRLSVPVCRIREGNASKVQACSPRFYSQIWMGNRFFSPSPASAVRVFFFPPRHNCSLTRTTVLSARAHSNGCLVPPIEFSLDLICLTTGPVLGRKTSDAFCTSSRFAPRWQWTVTKKKGKNNVRRPILFIHRFSRRPIGEFSLAALAGTRTTVRRGRACSITRRGRGRCPRERIVEGGGDDFRLIFFASYAQMAWRSTSRSLAKFSSPKSRPILRLSGPGKRFLGV